MNEVLAGRRCLLACLLLSAPVGVALMTVVERAESGVGAVLDRFGILPRCSSAVVRSVVEIWLAGGSRLVGLECCLGSVCLKNCRFLSRISRSC